MKCEIRWPKDLPPPRRRKAKLPPVPVAIADDPSIAKHDPEIEKISDNGAQAQALNRKLGAVDLVEQDGVLVPRGTALPDDLGTIAARIRGRIKRTTDDMIDNGRDLQTVKGRLDHGLLGAWVDRELGMSLRWAQTAMEMAECAKAYENFSLLPLSVAGLLAGPSTPAEIVVETIGHVAAGEAIKFKEVSTRVRQARAEQREAEEQRRVAEDAAKNAAARKKQAASRKRYQEERDRGEAERRAKVDAGHRARAEQMVVILRKLDRTDAEELLAILMGQGYGTPDAVLGHARRMLREGAGRLPCTEEPLPTSGRGRQ